MITRDATSDFVVPHLLLLFCCLLLYVFDHMINLGVIRWPATRHVTAKSHVTVEQNGA